MMHIPIVEGLTFDDVLLVRIMVGSFGLDPAKDIRWVSSQSHETM